MPSDLSQTVQTVCRRGISLPSAAADRSEEPRYNIITRGGSDAMHEYAIMIKYPGVSFF